MTWPHEPDPEEKVLRLICGGLFGAVLGLVVMFRLNFLGIWQLLTAAFLGGAVCGIFAMRDGDAFWYSLRDWWRL